MNQPNNPPPFHPSNFTHRTREQNDPSPSQLGESLLLLGGLLLGLAWFSGGLSIPWAGSLSALGSTLYHLAWWSVITLMATGLMGLIGLLAWYGPVAWAKRTTWLWEQQFQRYKLALDAAKLGLERDKVQQEVALMVARIGEVEAQAQAIQAKATATLLEAQAKAERLRFVVQPVSANRNILTLDTTHADPLDTARLFTAPAVIKGEGPPAKQLADTHPIRRENWLTNFVLKNQQANFSHCQIVGATGSGKTTVALAVIELLQRPLTKAEYHLSDPKWEGVLSNWPFDPAAIEFDEAPQFAEFCYAEVYHPRKIAVRRGELPTHSAFMIFDEVDGCYAEHSGAFINPIKRVLKEGRHAKCHGILIGQSPLAQDTGLNTSDLQQCARIILRTEAIRLLNSPAFPYASDKAQKLLWRDQLKQLEQNNERSALVIPRQGLPFVGVVPDIQADSLAFENLAQREPRAVLAVSDKDKQLLAGYGEGVGFTQLASVYFDKELSKISGRHTKAVQVRLKELGIKQPKK